MPGLLGLLGELLGRGLVWLGYLLALPLLLVTARSGAGRRLGVMAWLIIGLGLNWLILVSTLMFDPGGPPVHPWLTWAALLSFGGFTLLLVLLLVCGIEWLLNSPSYDAQPTPELASTFLGPVWVASWQMNLTPEADLLATGAAVLSRCVPWMRRTDARQIREQLHELLDEMADDPGYARLAPALPLTLLSAPWRPATGHHYAYVPPHAPGERLGLVIALHGNGGNVALWLHLWRPLAEQQRLVIVCPTYGVGIYSHPDAPAAVLRHREYAVQRWLIDPCRIYLAGISDGAVGVWRTAAVAPDAFAGLIALSPSIHPVLEQTAFHAAWRGRPIFVLQGRRDWNVSPAWTAAAVEQLQRHGVPVEFVDEPEGDHFVFIARRSEMLQRIGQWMQRAEPLGASPSGASPTEPAIAKQASPDATAHDSQ